MSKHDKLITETLKKVDAKKEEVKKLKKQPWESPGTIEFQGKQVNLKTCQNVELLIKIHAELTLMSQSYSKSSKELLGLEKQYEILSYGVDKWLKDIYNRCRTIHAVQELKKIEVIGQRLKGIVSEDMKTQLELDSILQELG